MAFNSQFLRMMPPVTKNLVMANIFVFLLMMLMPASTEVMVRKYLALHYFTSPVFNPAQLFTYMFIHGGFMHLFFNMFALFMFGPMIEWRLGSRRFLFFYISCGIGAALIQEGVFAIMIQKYADMYSTEEFKYIIDKGAQILYSTVPQNFVDPTAGKLNLLVNTPVVGASGAIYGVLLAYGMLFPDHVIYLLVPPMPLKAKYMVIGYVIIELVYGVADSADGVAHFAHLGGMLVAFIMLLYWKKKGMNNGGF